MDLKTFAKFYKTDFNLYYVADYRRNVKSGFYYYRAIELIEKNRDVVFFFSDSVMTWESLCAEFKKLFKENEGYFKSNFRDFNYELKHNFINYCWVKVRINQVKKVVSELKNYNPEKNNKSVTKTKNSSKSAKKKNKK